MSAQVAADLRAAAEVLRRDGWTQDLFHRLIDGKICHCAEGAIAVAVGDHVSLVVVRAADGSVDWTSGPDAAYERRIAAEEILAEHVDAPRFGWVPGWNDHPKRTADEVIAALLAAADAAEAKS